MDPLCKPIGGDLGEADMMMMGGMMHPGGPPGGNDSTAGSSGGGDGSGGGSGGAGGGGGGRKTKAESSKDKARGSYRCGKVNGNDIISAELLRVWSIGLAREYVLTSHFKGYNITLHFALLTIFLLLFTPCSNMRNHKPVFCQ